MNYANIQTIRAAIAICEAHGEMKAYLYLQAYLEEASTANVGIADVIAALAIAASK